MLRLYHSPRTRSSRILWLIGEMGISDEVEIVPVHIARSDGSSGPDPANPHPEGKVPVLEDENGPIMESGAIVLYLTDRFPASGLGRSVGDRERGAYLSWLYYYGDVIEPVLMAQFGEMEPDALFTSTFRGPVEMADRLEAALTPGPWLMGTRFSAVDILIAAPFIWFPAMLPDRAALRAWRDRCAQRPEFQKATQRDQEFPQS